MNVREVLRRLTDDGWTIIGYRGSHRQLRHKEKPGKVTVAGKPSDELPPKTREQHLSTGGPGEMTMNAHTLDLTEDVEQERKKRLADLAEDENLGWEDRFRPGTFGHHELLDRAALLSRLVEETLLQHPACLLDSESYALADRAVAALNDLYQRAGSMDLHTEAS